MTTYTYSVVEANQITACAVCNSFRHVHCEFLADFLVGHWSLRGRLNKYEKTIVIAFDIV